MSRKHSLSLSVSVNPAHHLLVHVQYDQKDVKYVNRDVRVQEFIRQMPNRNIVNGFRLWYERIAKRFKWYHLVGTGDGRTGVANVEIVPIGEITL